MRRWIVTAVAVAAGLAGAVAIAPAANAASFAPSACTGTVKITSFAFNPATIVAGQSSSAVLSARNCTAQSLQTTTYWYGTWIGSAPGIPAGCPAIDPLPRPLTFAPRASAGLSTSYLVFAGCTATALQVKVQIVGSVGTLATATATLAITH
jgi:hypothetical protein